MSISDRQYEVNSIHFKVYMELNLRQPHPLQPDKRGINLRALTMLLATAMKLAGSACTWMMKFLFPFMRQSRYALRLAAIGLCACTVFYPGGPAQAVEGGSGVYALGLTGPQAGIMPDPGTYVGYNLYYYKGDATANVSLSGKVPIPGTGFELPAQLNGSVEAEAESFAHILTMTHVFKKELMGAKLGLSVWVPYVDTDLTLTGNGVLSLTRPLGGTLDIPISGSTEQSENGVGDTTFIGMMGWHRGSMHYMAMLNVYVPTGEYDKNQAVNVGRNHWAIDPMLGVTYLNEKIGLELSAAAGITFNLENSDTDYKSGEEFHLDLAVIQHLSDKFHLGLVGYVYNQLSGDSGSGAADDFKGRVYAWGPVIGATIPLWQKHNLFLKGRYYNEFDALNRLEGEVYLFTATVNF